MKRKICLLLIALIIVFSVGCKANEATDESSNNQQAEISEAADKNDEPETAESGGNVDYSPETSSQYSIRVDFDQEKREADCTERVTYYNTESVDLDKVYFHVYPNAFKDPSSMPLMSHDDYDSEFDPGYITFNKISANGSNIAFSINGEDETILELELDQPLKAGEQIDIEIEFVAKLPSAEERYGYSDNIFNFGNWYPVLAVYDEDGWNLDPYYSVGDPFYSDTSDYDVVINVPEGFNVAASGDLKEKLEKNSAMEYHFVAEKMRDFAFVTSPRLKDISKTVDGTEVKSFYLEGYEDKGEIEALEHGVNSIEIFNETFGKYPYKTYTVVQTNHPSGMEFPGIVFISKEYYEPGLENPLEVVIVHETGHQWFYGIVGNDQIDEAWLDESLTSFTEFVYFEKMYSESRGEAYARRFEASFTNSKNMIDDFVLVKPVNQFVDWIDYGALIYRRGPLMLRALREELGDEKFFRLLQEYFEENKYGIAKTEDFLDKADEVAERDLKEFFEKWLYSVDK